MVIDRCLPLLAGDTFAYDVVEDAGSNLISSVSCLRVRPQTRVSLVLQVLIETKRVQVRPYGIIPLRPEDLRRGVRVLK